MKTCAERTFVLATVLTLLLGILLKNYFKVIGGPALVTLIKMKD